MHLPSSRPSRFTANSFNQLRRHALIIENLEARCMLSASPLSQHLESGREFSQIESQQIELALNHLAQDSPTAYLQQGISGLRVLDVDSGTTTVFQQTHDGIPVYGAIITVVQSSDGGIDAVFDHGRQNLTAVSGHGELLGASEAIEVVAADLELLGHDSDPVWFPTGRDLSLAWQVSSGEVFESGLSRYMTIVDAKYGDILSHEKLDEGYLDQFASETGVFPRIVINNDIGAAGSRDYAAPFDAVAELSQGCSGTLIASDLVIAARHCGSGSQVRFGDNGNSPTYVANVASTSYPAGGGSLLDGGDVSLVRLTQPVPTNIATPMRLIEEGDALVGEVAVTLGYGYNGLGSSGHGFSADGFRWGGENIIDVYGSPAANSGSNIFSTDFDNGTAAANTISGSDPTPLEFEATTAPGDSGGPLLVQTDAGEWVIAGVLSGGTTFNSVYGDISWWTGVQPFRDQIEAAGGEFVGGGVGTVQLNQGIYELGDTIEVTVRDPNAVLPVQVTLTSESGDSETITLTNTTGSNYAATIDTATGTVVSGDALLQVALFDEIVATYEDPDNGMGSPITATSTAYVATTNQYVSEDVPVSILDLQTVTSDLFISDSGSVLDIDVQLNISHTWVEDLNVFLEAPDGTRVELFSDVGGNGNNFNDTILDDEAATPIGSGAAPFVGRFSPAGNLSDFRGMDLAGTWTLEIFDDFSADQGTLNDWSIYAAVESVVVTGDFDGDGDYDCDDINPLMTEIAAGTNNPAYDLTGEGVVNLADRDAWLAEAGEANLGPGLTYLLGDANLDGIVDGRDFLIWNMHKFGSGSWCEGDFDGDGQVDGSDFVLWNANKFQSSDVQAVVFRPMVEVKHIERISGSRAPAPALANRELVSLVASDLRTVTQFGARDTVFGSYGSAGDRDDETMEHHRGVFAAEDFAATLGAKAQELKGLLIR